MNINDNPERLKSEEQDVLDTLISDMNKVLNRLDFKMQQYVEEARNAQISVNPDLYLSKLLAQKGIRDTEENRKKLLQARDELYHTRLLLGYHDYSDETGIMELKIGLHSCRDNGKQYVISWKMPLCRHYILDNSSMDYEYIDKDNYGTERHTRYTLLVKNQVKLRFTRVAKAMNLHPGILDTDKMNLIKGTGFFSDAFLEEMAKNFDPDKFDPEEAAKIISDEFLQELLERRTSPEFKNIVFSIQKKQGEIIQTPYQKNMIVQGCAGSGKSMIMLHRLPILLYDHTDSLARTNLYIITPSQMYIQLAESMRNQLEISDINMGTIEEYYDLCISRYPGHKAQEYGKVSYSAKLSAEDERYVYSGQCIQDIEDYFEGLCNAESISTDKAYAILKLKYGDQKTAVTYARRLAARSREFRDVLSANNNIVIKYFRSIRDIIDNLNALSSSLNNCRSLVIRQPKREAERLTDIIKEAEKEIEKLNPEQNEIAIRNRNEIIRSANKRIDELASEIAKIESDEDYFTSIKRLSSKTDAVLESFTGLKPSFGENTSEDVYRAVDQTGYLIGSCYMLAWEYSKLEDKYGVLAGQLDAVLKRINQSVTALQSITDKYLEFEYYVQIRKELERITAYDENAIKNAYQFVMEKIGVKPGPSGNIRALKCSPYIYLQILYLYYGANSLARETLLAIDEVQSLAPEEIRLLKHVNGDKVVFNMYGDIHQHIEGTKGIDSWDEYNTVIDYDYYEMQENYRNASQITEYCNRIFGMKMIAINTPGKGAHEIKSIADMHAEMTAQLMDTQRAGLAAILVSSIEEAKYIQREFSAYRDKMHDMTSEDFSIHRTRWNIITIDDAKGLEFSTVIALSGGMSQNQKYIAYTRALDDLYVCDFPLETVESAENVATAEKETDGNVRETKNDIAGQDLQKENLNFLLNIYGKRDGNKTGNEHQNSEVRLFFEEKGLEVLDARDAGGRLWVIGEKTVIRDTVNEAIAKFKISGKYASSKEINNRSGWCTKTDK